MAVSENQQIAEETASPEAAQPPARILVVDDNEPNRDALSRRLQRRGYEVILAQDGPEALDKVGQSKFDLVLLDVMMPGMSGLEVLERLRQSLSPTELPVIMATAKDQSDDVVKALTLGANDYVTKPLDFPIVLARVKTQLSLKHYAEQNHDLERRLSLRNAELESAADLMRRDLHAAAMIQRSHLPRSAPDYPGIRFAWQFNPCEALAGDSLNICPLDEQHIAAYVLDVAGHGVAAALLAVAATRALSPASDPHSLLLDRTNGIAPVLPAEVAHLLNQQFAWDAATKQFLTLFYTVVNAKTGVCRYVSAGHPMAIHVPRGKEPVLVAGEGSGLPIGIGENYKDFSLILEPGDRLYLYSDGVTEAMDPNREMFGKTRLMENLERNRSASLENSVSLLAEELRQWCASPPKDDLSVLAIERE